MPRFDGSGPWWGFGPGSGRGMGPCGLGFGRFFRGRGYGRRWTEKDELTALSEEENFLEEELKAVRQQKQTLQAKK